MDIVQALLPPNTSKVINVLFTLSFSNYIRTSIFQQYVSLFS
uniref:Uncharacterized protein n=1 Tax=Arundo donax TaxID=35708 RepID=A0A0A9HNN4_ARUDO